MQEAFVIVVIAVGVVGVLGALATLLTGRRAWEEFGSDRLLLDSDLPREPAAARAAAANTPAARAERDEDIRQMLHARNARRERRGEPPLDVEAELARLTAAPVAPSVGVGAELQTEIRQLVVARNARRRRRGLEPLDVEAEVARQIAELSG